MIALLIRKFTVRTNISLAPIQHCSEIKGQTSKNNSILQTFLILSGEEMMGDSLYYETGPYGSFKDGSWFTDFRQDLNGRHWQPIHWPEIINIRAGEAIDG